MISSPKTMSGRVSPANIMPAEWEPHEATWIGWPQNLTDWPGKFTPIPWVYAEIVRKLTEGEKVRILVDSKRVEQKAKDVLTKVGVNNKMVEFFQIPTNRGWTRDMGPMFIRQGKKKNHRTILRFGFSGWAKYPNWQKDGTVPERVSKILKIPLFDAMAADRRVVLEGGSIDVNGRGTLITTEECLLHPKIQVRNPGFSRKDYESVFSKYLGASNVIWLGKGIAGDDTHGHVDDLCRFVNLRTVVLCAENNKNDDNYKPLCENLERLQTARLEDGSRPEVIPLPMPAPLYFNEQRLPASYANFYISNAAALVPTFNDPNDRHALGILGELITDRPVIGIHAVDLVWGLGTLHCLTQQQPGR
ncbi:MAG: agmatine/peptidylarginine deiminase [Bacteroidota bacterium]